MTDQWTQLRLFDIDTIDKSCHILHRFYPVCSQPGNGNQYHQNLNINLKTMSITRLIMGLIGLETLVIEKIKKISDVTKQNHLVAFPLGNIKNLYKWPCVLRLAHEYLDDAFLQIKLSFIVFVSLSLSFWRFHFVFFPCQLFQFSSHEGKKADLLVTTY